MEFISAIVILALGTSALYIFEKARRNLIMVRAEIKKNFEKS